MSAKKNLRKCVTPECSNEGQLIMGMRAALCGKCMESAPNLRAIAIDLLNEAHIPATEPDITILADDLAKVHYEPRIDGAYASDRTVRELFLSRLGGIGALSRYLLGIRPKGKR